MAQQPPSTEYYESRTMWHRVSRFLAIYNAKASLAVHTKLAETDFTQRGFVPGFRQYIPRLADVEGKVQREHRICIPSKLQNPAKYVLCFRKVVVGLDANLEILGCFKQKGIDRPVNVEQLIKCKMQDNLEFLQWSKRYWDQYFPGGDYDAVARRRGSGAPAPAAAAPRASGGAARRGTTPTIGGARVGKAAAGGAGSAALQQENNTLKETVQGLERERDFYFSKLRDIELLVQQACEEDPEIERQEDGLIKHIQSILYSTEDGFEIPAEAEVDDQETF